MEETPKIVDSIESRRYRPCHGIPSRFFSVVLPRGGRRLRRL